MFQTIVSRVASRYRAKQALLLRLALRQRTFLSLMSQGGSFGIISAYTPGSKSKNQAQHGDLFADLQRLGYHKITTLRGKWEGVSEKSVLIRDIRPEHLFVLGVKYKQDATIFKSANGIVGMYYPGGGYAEVAVDPATLSPVVETALDRGLFSKERNWSFSLGFLWGQKIPWDGRHPVTPNQVDYLVAPLLAAA